MYRRCKTSKCFQSFPASFFKFLSNSLLFFLFSPFSKIKDLIRLHLFIQSLQFSSFTASKISSHDALLIDCTKP